MQNRIKILREQKKLTQEALAEMIDSTPPTVQRLESGERRLSDKWVWKLSKALDCHPGSLFSEMPAGDDGLDEDLMMRVFLKTYETSERADHKISEETLGGFMIRFYLLCLGKSEANQDALLEAMSSEALHAGSMQK